MASLEEIREERIKKLRALEKNGGEPYPITSRRDEELGIVVKEFSKLSRAAKKLSLVGRVMSLRPQGGLIFFHFDDGTGRLQGLVKKGEEIADEAFDLFLQTVDIGDFVEVRGTLFLTKRKEKTLLIGEWRMLAKSLRSLPEKWHGLTDTEERFRRRYLDMLMNPEVRERFVVRSRMVTEIRKFFNDHGYLEVETPRLQILPGGATAKPFVTHYNALDTDLYLTIAQELYLKQLVIGGMNKVYEIGRKFRNEGIDATHNPEFTMLESQEAYADADAQRQFTEALLKHVVKKIFGASTLTYEGKSIDFGKKFAVVSFFDLLRRFALISEPGSLNREQAAVRGHQLGVEVKPEDALEKILDNMYKKTARPKLIQPTFIVDFPVAFNPFAKRKKDAPELIDRFQLIAGGIELVNAFSELNNPIDQAARYEEQDRKKKKGDGEISPSDKAYLEAMEYGMPPNGGIGIGIDRLAMLLTDVKNIKEVILFPTLRPKND